LKREIAMIGMSGRLPEPIMSPAIATDPRRPSPVVTGLIVSEVVLSAGFGLVLLLMPQWPQGLVGLAPAAATTLWARLFGTAMIYVAFLHGWQGHAPSSPALRGVAWANVLRDGLAAEVLCIGTLQGTLNAMGWPLAAAFAGMMVLNALALRSLPGA
jgi:hypothetical protein